MPACTYCGYDFVRGLNQCPHCYQPGLFPNVQMASDGVEVAALDKRYDDALELLGPKGQSVAQRLATLAKHAVITRSLLESLRLATEESAVYVPFYKATASGARLPEGSQWDAWRRITDSVLFPNCQDEIRFGCLSTDVRGLRNYGLITWILSERMIAHRASVFEENSVIWLRKRMEVLDAPTALPTGYRTTWDRRGRLCIAKLATQLDDSLTDAHLAELLLTNGTTRDTDVCVEIHVFGSITIRTIGSMAVCTSTPITSDLDKDLVTALQALLPHFNVGFATY